MDEKQDREGTGWGPYGLRLALNVRLQGIRPELLLGIIIISDLCRVSGAKVLITAVLNGLHMRNSLHFVGGAVDFTVELLGDRAIWVAELKDRLAINYDVVDEDTHIHVEFQPHTGATS